MKTIPKPCIIDYRRGGPSNRPSAKPVSCEQGYLGEVSDDGESGVMRIFLIQAGAFSKKAKTIVTADDAIDAIHEVCNMAVYKPDAGYPNRTRFISDWVRGAKAGYDQLFHLNPTWNVFRAGLDFTAGDFLADGIGLPRIRTNEKIKPSWHSFRGFDRELIKSATRRRKRPQDLFFMAEKLSHDEEILKYYQRVEERSGNEATIGSFIACSSSIILRTSITKYAEKYKIPLITDRITHENGIARETFFSNENCKEDELCPFTAIMRSPAAWINNLNIIHHRETNGGILFSYDDLDEICEFLNLMQDYYEPFYESSAIPTTGENVLVPTPNMPIVTTGPKPALVA